jgi:hypothetical protein
MFVLARSVWLAMLGALATIPLAKLFGAAPKMQLFTNNISPGPLNVVSDFTAPTWTGYADQAVTLAGPYTNAAGLCFENVADVTWTGLLATESAIIYGYILKDSVLGYLGGAKFDTPLTIQGTTGAIIIGQEIQIDPTQTLGPVDTD